MSETFPNDRQDDEILDLACGELNAARRAEVEKSIAADPARAAAAKELKEALDAVRRLEGVAPSSDFNEKLRRKLEGEHLPAARDRRWIHRLAVPASIAATLLVGIFLGTILRGGRLDPTGGKIAWADVIRAMNQVPYFRAVVLEETRDEAFWLEYHFRRPDLWRAHGMDRVQFYARGKVRTFDAKEKRFIEDLGNERGPLPPVEVLDEVTRGDLLDGILRALFRDEVPAGEPVPSSVEAQGGDIEVFDHAKDPRAGWLRIWVLKASRLPLRLELSEPERDVRTLVVFDYSDPQAEEFFDPEKFGAEAKDKHFRSPRQYYRIGQRPVGQKPRGPEQIHEMQGYRFPRPLEVETNEDGDILIVSEDPRNRSPSGSPVGGEYCEELHDNWGNLYLRYYEHRVASEGKLRQHYMVLPPKREGQGTQILTLRYTVWDYEGGIGYDRVVGEEKIEVPRAAPKGTPGPLSDESARTQFWKQQAVLQYFVRSDLTHGRMDFIDRELAKEPDSAYLLLAKCRLLELLGDEEEAASIHDRLADEGLARPFGKSETDIALADRLRAMLRAGNLEEFWRTVEKVEAAGDALIRNDEKRGRAAIDSSPLEPFLKARQGFEEMKKLPVPQVERIASSEDGHLSMVISLPETGKKSRFGGSSWMSAGSPAPKPETAWTIDGCRSEGRRLFLKLRGRGDRLELVFDPLVTVNERMLWELRLPWTLAVDVPAPSLKTREDLDALFPQLMNPPTPPIYQDIFKAHELFRSGRHEAALDAYRKILERPEDDWPRPPDPNASARSQILLAIRLNAAQCLVKLDRLDEARGKIGEIEGWVRSVEIPHALDEVFHARLAIPERLLERGLPQEARKELEGIARSMPDFRTLDNLHRLRKVSHGVAWVQARKEAAAPWRHFDAVEWKLTKLLEKSR